MTLERFHKAYGSGESCERPSKEEPSKHAAVVPEPLLEDWQQHGFCGYQGGLLWTVNPDKFVDVVKEWLPDWSGDPRTFVFMRTAFGDPIVSHQESVGHLSVHYGRYIDLNGDIEMFMEYSLTRSAYVNNALDGKLARQALKLQRQASDEVTHLETESEHRPVHTLREALGLLGIHRGDCSKTWPRHAAGKRLGKSLRL